MQALEGRENEEKKKKGKRQIYWPKKGCGQWEAGRAGGRFGRKQPPVPTCFSLKMVKHILYIYFFLLWYEEQPAHHCMGTMVILVKVVTKYLQNDERYLQQKRYMYINQHKKSSSILFQTSKSYIVHVTMPILCLLQNMGLKETQEFPSPEQFVRNNYGKWKKIYFHHCHHDYGYIHGHGHYRNHDHHHCCHCHCHCHCHRHHHHHHH